MNAPTALLNPALAPLLLAIGFCPDLQCVAEELDADQIMARASDYSKWETSQLDSNTVTYSKYTLTEQLDNRGGVKKRTEETFEVEFKSDQIRIKMLADDKTNSAAPPSRREEKPINLKTAVISKFNFVLVERQTINNRESYLLAFAPKDNLREQGLTDRFLNRITGWVWIDAQDFAIAQARVRLLAPVTLWGGMLGALKEFRYDVDRTRLSHGFWFNKTSRSRFNLRKLFVSKRFKTLSRWTDVQIHKKKSTSETTAPTETATDQKPNPNLK